MRRTVQGLFARRLLFTNFAVTNTATSTVAVRMLSSERQSGLYGAMAYLMGGEYVCSDCRRQSAEEKRRRRVRSKARGLHTTRAKGSMEETTKEAVEEKRRPELGEGRRRLEEAVPVSMLQPKNAIRHWSELVASDMPTFLRLQSEADLGERTEKLVDHGKFSTDLGLWRLLLNFSKRVNPDAGIKKIWMGMRERQVDIPTEGEHGDAIWRVYVSAALGDEEFTDSIISYAEELSTRTGGTRRWPHLYDTIMYYHLVNSSSLEVEKYHRWLFPRFESASWKELFRRTAIANPSGGTLRHLHAMLPQPAGLYESIVRTICLHSKNKFRDALRWHHYLLKLGDHPPSSASSDHLIRLTARFGNFDEFEEEIGRAHV